MDRNLHRTPIVAAAWLLLSTACGGSETAPTSQMAPAAGASATLTDSASEPMTTADSSDFGMGMGGQPVQSTEPEPTAAPAVEMPADDSSDPAAEPEPEPEGFQLAPEFSPVAEGYEELPLFEGDPPLFRADAPEEFKVENDMIRNVSVPALRRHAFDAEQATGVGLIVFPGGGYYLLDIETHATALAERLGPQGIAVFALKYRCGDGADDVPAAALLDAKRALRLVRANAAEWGVDPELVGAAGYSAGSHLVLNLSSNFDGGDAAAADPVEQESSRPAFVASLSSWAFGEPTSPFEFTAQTPSTFLAHAEDDDGAPITLARDVQRQLEELAVPVKLLEIPTGGHSAFHVADPDADGRNWTEEFLPWLAEQGILPDS